MQAHRPEPLFLRKSGCPPQVAARLVEEATRTLLRLRVVRGASRRTAQRMARAAAVLVVAVGLLGGGAASAAVPAFAAPSTNPFGLARVSGFSAPAFADIDADGDLDAFIGDEAGDTVFFRNTGSAAVPAFAAPSTNPFGLADVGYASAPVLVDIDGDGDLDALIGKNTGDTVFFRNTGSAAAPAFAAPSTNPFGLAKVFAGSPAFADIDGDGDLDAFIGDGGGTAFFRNTGSATAPAFAAPSTNPFGLVNVGIVNRAAFADIDGDGDLDAFFGEYYGTTVFFRNTGSATAPAFAAPSTNPFGLADVGIGSLPAFVDIDGDGDLDAFIGEYVSGDTIFFRNDPSPEFFSAPSTNPFGLAHVRENTPALTDIDGDGDLDAFIGDGYGPTVFFRNTGSAAVPAFAAPSTNPFGLAGLEANSPAFADIDGDGDLDAFIGDFVGDTVFFRNTGTAATPAFAAPSTNPFGLANLIGLSAPAFADIDGDGDLDAFIGEFHGDTVFFRNTGTAAAPAFAAPSTNPFGLTNVGSDSSPVFVDIDGDGDLDAFIGNEYGDTVFFRNTGSAAAPAFAAPAANPFGLARVSGFSAPAFADIDADGDLDAFIGDYDGDTVFFRNDTPHVGTSIGAVINLYKSGRFKLVSKGSFPLTQDATATGVVLTATGNGSFTETIAGASCTGDTTKGFKCKGSLCSVIIKPSAIKAVCKGNGTLALPGTDTLTKLTVGPDHYCALCGGSAVGNTAKIFKRKGCPVSSPACEAPGTSTTTTPGSTTTTTTVVGSGTCCNGPGGCTGGFPADNCTTGGGTPGASGTVCGSTGTCVAPPATPGNCCQFPAGCDAGPVFDSSFCEGTLGGTYHGAAVCLASGSCSP